MSERVRTVKSISKIRTRLGREPERAKTTGTVLASVKIRFGIHRKHRPQCVLAHCGLCFRCMFVEYYVSFYMLVEF